MMNRVEKSYRNKGVGRQIFGIENGNLSRQVLFSRHKPNEGQNGNDSHYSSYHRGDKPYVAS